MTDRELLTLAARPFGIEVIGGIAGDDGVLLFNGNIWNPLTDDGDALRLAVKLHICVFNNGYVSWAATGSLQEVRAEETNNGDPYAATRRAVVRAAAEIGKLLGKSDVSEIRNDLERAKGARK